MTEWCYLSCSCGWLCIEQDQYTYYEIRPCPSGCGGYLFIYGSDECTLLRRRVLLIDAEVARGR